MISEHASASETEQDGGEWETTQHSISDEHARRVGECFQKNHAQIVRWLELKSGSFATARDIADDAFEALLRLRNPVQNLTPYLYKIASNMLGRRRQTEARHRRLEVRVRAAEDGEVGCLWPELQLAEEQQANALRIALEDLPPRVRLAIRLRFWDELSWSEIVQQFRTRGVVTNVRTVQRWVVHAVKQCKKALDDCSDRREGSKHD